VLSDVFGIELEPVELIGPGSKQVDFSVSKRFPLGATRLEFRAEIFNLLNSKNGTRFVRNSAGQYEPTIFAGDTGQGEQRLAQLGLRLRF